MNKAIERNGVILYTHPYNGSYSHATLKAAEQAYIDRGVKYTVIDLNKENFDPVDDSSAKNVALIEKYQKLLLNATELVVLYPVWWSGPPALLKGFLDLVLEEKKFYTETIGKRKGIATNIRAAYVFTTSATPNMVARFALRWPTKTSITRGTLKVIGVKNIKFKNIDKLGVSSERRERFLRTITKMIKKGGRRV